MAKKIHIGNVLRTNSGEHVAVIKCANDAAGCRFFECINGDGEIVHIREKSLSEANYTPYKVNVDMILGALKTYDRCNR